MTTAALLKAFEAWTEHVRYELNFQSTIAVKPLSAFMPKAAKKKP